MRLFARLLFLPLISPANGDQWIRLKTPHFEMYTSESTHAHQPRDGGAVVAAVQREGLCAVEDGQAGGRTQKRGRCQRVGQDAGRNGTGNPAITVLITLDRSQAGGVHEKALLEADQKYHLAASNTHFVIGQSETHQISHTKGFVADGRVAGKGSTNWSAAGEGTFVVTGKAGGPGYKAQNNTQPVITDQDTIVRFQTELIAEHTIAISAPAKTNNPLTVTPATKAIQDYEDAATGGTAAKAARAGLSDGCAVDGMAVIPGQYFRVRMDLAPARSPKEHVRKRVNREDVPVF